MFRLTAVSASPLPTEPAERVRLILEKVLSTLDLEAQITIEESESVISAAIDGKDEADNEDLGMLIGRRGQTIDAIQLLCYRGAFTTAESRKRVTVDAAGYRSRREEMLDREADSAAEVAVAEARPVNLEPMTASERRAVHEHLKERPGLETYSEGDEPDRFVVVAPIVSA